MTWVETTTLAAQRLALSPSPSWMAPVDWCSAPVVLRSLLWVNGVAFIIMLAHAAVWGVAWRQMALLAALVQPALLLWLVLCCAFKRPVAKLRSVFQYAVVLSFAAFAAWFAWFVAYSVLPLDARVASPWVVVLIAMFAVAPLFHYLLLRQRAAVPRAQQAHLADLEQRIRPHFLFNSLNAVSALITIDPRKAEEALDDLSELYRMLTRRPSGLLPLSDEVELARRYLAVEKVRFGDRMQVHWFIEESMLSKPVPTLCLQPLVENAVKHGVEATPGDVRIDIKAQLDGGRLMIRVINTAGDVTAYRPSGGSGTALANLRERLALVYDIAADWEIKPMPNKFQVTLWLPL